MLLKYILKSIDIFELLQLTKVHSTWKDLIDNSQITLPSVSVTPHKTFKNDNDNENDTSIIYKIKIHQDLSHQDLSHQSLKNFYQHLNQTCDEIAKKNAEPYFLIELKKVQDLSLVALSLEGYEDDMEITSKNLFLRLTVERNEEPGIVSLLLFLQQIQLLSPETKWSNLVEYDKSTIAIYLKKTELTSISSLLGLDELVHSSHQIAKNITIKVLIGRTYDFISKKGYWYCHELGYTL